jgi:D-inositol-3-phosphate glycosyltransferase
MLDTVVDGRTGRLIPPRRPDELATVLRELLDDERTRRSMGAQGVRSVARTYAWDRVAALTEASYDRAASVRLRRRELTGLPA